MRARRPGPSSQRALPAGRGADRRKPFPNRELSGRIASIQNVPFEGGSLDVGQQIHPEQVDQPEDEESDSMFQPGRQCTAAEAMPSKTIAVRRGRW